MGGRYTYRWERRKEKLKSRDFDPSGLFFFQCLQILLAFFLFIIGLRFSLPNAFTAAACMEMVVGYGLSGETSVFRMFFYVSSLCLAFSIAVSWSFRKQLRSQLNGVYQAIMALAFMTAAICFNALHVPDLTPPDGTLPVEPLIETHLADGTIVYNSYVDPYAPYTQWRLKTSPQLELRGETHYDRLECVWLDENKITVTPHLRDDNYHLVPDAEKYDYLMSKEHDYESDWYQKYSVIDWVKMYWIFFTGREPTLENILDLQTFRELAPEERERFLNRQHCLDQNIYVIPKDNPCHYYRVTDWEQVPLDLRP